MRTTDIVLRLKEPHIPILEIGNPDNYPALHKILDMTIDKRSADIVYKGDYFRLDHNLLPDNTDSYTTYVLFRQMTLEDDADDNVWNQLKDELSRSNFPEIRGKNSDYQLIEMSSLSAGDKNMFSAEDIETEEILIRIAGTREELEFDPAGAEANKILYDRLAKLIYDREVEIMYKGPKLDFENDRDLFINPDKFSVYILFRSARSSNYEDTETLWANLSADLMVLSSITLLKSANNYQVLLLTHNENTFGDDDIQL